MEHLAIARFIILPFEARELSGFLAMIVDKPTERPSAKFDTTTINVKRNDAMVLSSLP